MQSELLKNWILSTEKLSDFKISNKQPKSSATYSNNNNNVCTIKQLWTIVKEQKTIQQLQRTKQIKPMFLQRYTLQNITEASLGLPQALNMESSATTVKKFQPLIIVAKLSILDVQFVSVLSTPFHDFPKKIIRCITSYVVIFLNKDTNITQFKKQPSRGVLRKRYSENMKQIYRRTPIPRCDFNKVALHLY